MGIVGFVGFGLVTGWKPSLAMIGTLVSETALNYGLSVVPLFILMGNLVSRAGLSAELYAASNAFLGHRRGGLSMATIVACGSFSAICGSSLATAATMSKVAMPPMRRYGYADSLATASIAAGGTLGILIPPSIMLVIMADQLGLSVGDLFMGAVFPGMILGAMYIGFILIYCYLKPDVAPLPAERRPISFRVVWDVFKTILPTAGLIFAVLGSIFAGITTPTEASGVGAMGATILAALNKKVNFKVIKEVTHATFKTTGYIFGIFIGATCFALVLRGMGGDELIERALTGLPLGPYGVMIVILGSVFLLGFFLDWIEITLIVLPLLSPVVAGLDIDINGYGVVDDPALIWFCVLVAVSLQTSFLTPPVGFAIFYLRGVAPKGVELIHIYKGVIPFIILQLIGLLIVAIWPQLVIWLPALAYG